MVREIDSTRGAIFTRPCSMPSPLCIWWCSRTCGIVDSIQLLPKYWPTTGQVIIRKRAGEVYTACIRRMCPKDAAGPPTAKDCIIRNSVEES